MVAPLAAIAVSWALSYLISLIKDLLFTAGPCILGASINDVLQLHRQTGFEPGDIQLFPDRPTGQNDEDPRFFVPGRSIVLKRDWLDRFPHRFIWEETNIVAAVTNIPNYDDRPETVEHYSGTQVEFGVYGLNKVYKDTHRANEEIIMTVVP